MKQSDMRERDMRERDMKERDMRERDMTETNFDLGTNFDIDVCVDNTYIYAQCRRA